MKSLSEIQTMFNSLKNPLKNLGLILRIPWIFDVYPKPQQISIIPNIVIEPRENLLRSREIWKISKESFFQILKNPWKDLLRIAEVRLGSWLESWLESCIGSRCEAHALYLERQCRSLLIQALPSWSSWISTSYFSESSWQLPLIPFNGISTNLKSISLKNLEVSHSISSNSSLTWLLCHWHRLYFSMFTKRKRFLCVCLDDSIDSLSAEISPLILLEILCHSLGTEAPQTSNWDSFRLKPNGLNCLRLCSTDCTLFVETT